MYSYYLSQFPESMYGVHPDHRAKYIKSVEAGYKLMAKSKVLIAGLARDIEPVLPQTFSRLLFLSSFFKDYRFLIFENDSKDKTANKLKELRKQSSGKLKLYSKKYNKERFAGRGLNRSEQMAFCRNRLRDFSFEYQEFADFVILVDLDLEGGFSYNGVASTFGNLADKQWDMVGSNSIFYRNNEETGKVERLFYDTWAFRPHKKWFVYDGDLDKNNLLWFNKGEPLVRVNSCFGGLGIYRREAWFCKEASYTTLNDEGKNDCDHPTFHKMLACNGFRRIFLNPSQITLYSNTGVC